MPLAATPAEPAAPKRGGTRTKMLVSAAQVMRERGAAGVTIDEVLARSGAPRGSVYYHFPDGRNQILTEALRYSGDSITAMIDDAAGRGARALLREFVGLWERPAHRRRLHRRLPGGGGSDRLGRRRSQLSAEAGVILGRWCTALTRAFVNDGFDEADAASLAVTSIAALEGAIVLCRSTRSVRPAQPGRRPARIPGQGKGIRRSATGFPGTQDGPNDPSPQ